MKSLLAILGALLLPLSLAAQPVTITVQPGSAGQSTPQATFFANDLMVKVTDQNGLPVANTQVNFINIDGRVFFATGTDFSGQQAAFTDASGIAVAPGLIGFVPGAAEVTVSTVGNEASSTSVALTVESGGPVRFVAVSGSRQKAAVNTTYAAPWVAQGFDSGGNVVPRAAALFFADSDQTQPTVTFSGRSSVWVRADGNGIAISPPFTANGVSGHDEGGVMSMAAGRSVQSDFFAYTNMPDGGGGSGGSGDGCGRQGKGNGNCGSSDAHSGGHGNNGNGKG